MHDRVRRSRFTRSSRNRAGSAFHLYGILRVPKQTHMRQILLLILAGLSLAGCKRVDPTPEYKGSFPLTPVNLGDINSPYDDYNSTSPWVGGSFPLLFSSNRQSGGKEFDFIFKMLEISMLKTDPTGTVNVKEYIPGGGSISDDYYQNASLSNVNVNTSANELGPYLVNLGKADAKNAQGNNVRTTRFALLYATDQGGNLDIRFVENTATGNYGQARDISFLNSSKDDAYPCIMPDTSAIYFCSDRDGNFDIYKAELSAASGFLNTLQDNSSRKITKDSLLSSGYEDKCPFIFGKLLVFASNRPGGYGGFDLYYSKWENGRWAAPVNFGNRINTASDEYRPIILTDSDFGAFTNNMMLFSSNRAGGKGGFDLYYVGIDK